MPDPRLMECSELTLEREMLRAAAAETAPTEVRRRALASLGLLGVAPPSAAVASATVGTGDAYTAGEGTLKNMLWWQAWYAKAALLFALSGAGAAAGTAYSWEREPGASGVERGALRLPARHTGEPVTLGHGPAAWVNGGSAPAPNGSFQLPAGAPRPISPAAPEAEDLSPRAASIREEVNLLDRARDALARGHEVSANRIIDEYFARYPHGELRVEAAAVRREARPSN